MSWDVEYTSVFEAWWNRLDAEEQVSVATVVEVLAEMRPTLQFPYSSDVKSSVPEADLLYDRHLDALKREEDPNA